MSTPSSSTPATGPLTARRMCSRRGPRSRPAAVASLAFREPRRSRRRRLLPRWNLAAGFDMARVSADDVAGPLPEPLRAQGPRQSLRVTPARPSGRPKRCRSRRNAQPWLGLRRALAATSGVVWRGRAVVSGLVTGAQAAPMARDGTRCSARLNLAAPARPGAIDSRR